jgi:hypothetical protein
MKKMMINDCNELNIDGFDDERWGLRDGRNDVNTSAVTRNKSTVKVQRL